MNDDTNDDANDSANDSADNTANDDMRSDMTRAEMLAARANEGRKLTDPKDLTRRTRRSFVTGGAAIAAGLFGFNKLQTGSTNVGLPRPLRAGFEFNERVWSTLGAGNGSAPEYDVSRASPIRVNGTRGLSEEIDLDAWTMDVQDDAGATIDTVSMDVIMDLPQVEMVTKHKCVEGWSTIAHWTGVRFSDFSARYAGDVTSADYVGMQTPDAGYYVGLLRQRMAHPQSLLVHSLDGAPLTQSHGAPLRFVTPNNYGIKSLKRLGIIQFTNTRPPDFWAERGYDWWSEF